MTKPRKDGKIKAPHAFGPGYSWEDPSDHAFGVWVAEHMYLMFLAGAVLVIVMACHWMLTVG